MQPSAWFWHLTGIRYFIEKGFPIKGLDAFQRKRRLLCIPRRNRKERQRQIVTNGGRVLGVTAKGDDLKQARANAYEAIDLDRV